MNFNKDIIVPAEISPAWISRTQKRLKKQLIKSDVKLNCQDLKELNSLGIAVLTDLNKTAQNLNHKLILSNFPPHLKPELAKAPVTGNSADHGSVKDSSLFYQLGHSTYELFKIIPGLIHLFVEAIHWSTVGFFSTKTILKGSSIAQMIQLGSSALPIVLLLSFLIGLTLAIQSAIQLEQFGASIYLASGIGISMVTEIGPMMTAVILAGRSGSSITAEISTMVVQDELRALNTMAINPLHFILLPRFWAMSITVPLLTACSDAIGVAAGYLISFFYLDIPTELFFKQLVEAVSITMLWQSMVKALCFAWIIALVSVYKGFHVRGGADAVGKATTDCVVTCIFSIIMADAIFSFIFYF